MNVINAIMGDGILVFPKQFATMGLSLGVGSLFLAAILMTYTLQIVGRVVHISNSPSYQGAAKALVGPTAGIGTSVTTG